MFLELVKGCRSFRRFDASRPVTKEQLRSFVECARYTPSGANLQKMRFSIFADKESCDLIFPTLRFGGYLKGWGGPSESERPTAYIAISSEDSELATLQAIDLGIVAEAIVLAAKEAGIGSCMLRSFGRECLDGLTGKPGMSTHLVIALGYPGEEVVISDSLDGEIKYYRDEKDRNVVPKLPLDTLIIRD